MISILSFRKSFFSFLALMFLFGCKVGPKYQQPIIETPIQWKETQSFNNAPVFEGLWWEIFDDEILNNLEQQAVIANPHLFASLDRIARARAIVGVDRSALYPQLNLNPSYTNTGQLFKIFLPNNGTLIPGTFPTIYRIHMLQYTMPLSMNYELDLWGKLRGQFDSAVFNAQAQEENLQTTLLMLTTDLAVNYFKLRSFDALMFVIEQHLDLLKSNLHLMQMRFQKGLISELDILKLQQEISDNEAAYSDTIRQRALQEHAIATLLGIPASSFCLDFGPLIKLPPAVQPNLPSQMILQRPDLRAAERQMASQHALIGVAYASFFPTLNLTGTLGFLSPELNQFLQWKSRLWMIGANAVIPIFNGGYHEAQLQISYADFCESLHNYQQKVFIAFQEVEDALINIEMQSKAYDSYIESSAFADKHTKLATKRYMKGLSNYLEVLDSERSKIQVEMNRVQILSLRYISTIQLIKALGGSWSFSFQPSSEEFGSCCQCEEGNQCSRPDIIENNISGH